MSTTHRRTLDPSQEYPCKGPFYLKFLLGEKVAAMLIGKAGSVISELELQTTSSIKLAPTGSHYPTTQERTAVVGCASAAGVKDVMRQCLRLQREYGVPPVFMRIVAPLTAIPSIIGRGGEIIRSLCSSLGVNIKIQDRVDGLGERIVDIRGQGDAEIIDGIMAIAEIIQKDMNPSEYASVLYPFHSGNLRSIDEYPPPQQQQHRHQQFVDKGPAKAPSLEVLSHPAKIAFLVPEKCRPSGKECGDIESQLEGVKISITPKDDIDCNVEIDGPLACIQAAHILLIKLVTDRLLHEQSLSR